MIERLAETFRERWQMQTHSRAQAQKGRLGHFLKPAYLFGLGYRLLPGFEQANICLGIERIRETFARKEGMRACSHTNIGQVPPIGQIVTTLVAWQRPVGN